MASPINISTMQGGSALAPQPLMGQPIVTMPSIPNPTPPPPQKLTVVTPAAAKADLSQKQLATNGVAAAMAQQTQNTLLNSFGQPINQAGGSPVPNGQPQQGQPAQGQPQQPAQGQQPAAQPGQTAAAPATPPAGTNPVTLPNGVTANYNPGTGTLTTQDGKQLSYVNGKWVDATTGQAPVATAGTGTAQPAIPSTGDPFSDYAINQLQQNQQALDMASATHQQQVGQILNGSFPLTADQQAQVAGLKSQLDQLRSQQEKANENSVRATKLLGIRSGRYQYAPGVQNEEVTNAIDEGITKIRDFDIQAASAVATLKQGFMDDDYKIINESYEKLQKSIEAKNTTLTQMQTAVKNAVDIQTAKLTQQKTELDIQEKQVDAAAQLALKFALKADGTLDLDIIEQIAEEQGVAASALYGAVELAQRDEKVFQQAESKFASDQLQAAAQLKATAASTAAAYASADASRASAANSYANADKTRAETAALAATSSPESQVGRLSETLALAQDLLSPTSTGKSAAVGASLQKLIPGADKLGLQPNRTTFDAKVDSLKAQLTLDNLKLLKGPMSDKDLAFLQAIGSTLNTGMSESEFDKALVKVITKLKSKGAVDSSTDAGGSTTYQTANGVTYVQGADGLYYPK